MSKQDKIKALKKALQPKQSKMDKLYYHVEGKAEPEFHSEIEGNGVKMVFSSLKSIENYLQFLKSE